MIRDHKNHCQDNRLPTLDSQPLVCEGGGGEGGSTTTRSLAWAWGLPWTVHETVRIPALTLGQNLKTGQWDQLRCPCPRTCSLQQSFGPTIATRLGGGGARVVGRAGEHKVGTGGGGQPEVTVRAGYRTKVEPRSTNVRYRGLTRNKGRGHAGGRWCVCGRDRACGCEEKILLSASISVLRENPGSLLF